MVVIKHLHNILAGSQMRQNDQIRQMVCKHAEQDILIYKGEGNTMQYARVPKKEMIAVGIITLLMAFMEITGLPSKMFVNVHIADIDPVYFALMLNFAIAGLLCFLLLRLFSPHWQIDLKAKGFLSGVKRYGVLGLFAAIVTFITLYIGLRPFAAKPTWGKVLIEGFIYYIGLGIIEEVYMRGLLLNLLERLFSKRKNPILWAVVISSALFGLGHIFGELGNSPLQMISKVVWTICLGIYFGAIYKKTGNLWVPIALHTLINFAAVPFCYSTTDAFPTVALFVILTAYILLGLYGMYIITQRTTPTRKKD